eukprot:54082-Pyramimonas_sp.AAC.1
MANFFIRIPHERCLTNRFLNQESLRRTSLYGFILGSSSLRIPYSAVYYKGDAAKKCLLIVP